MANVYEPEWDAEADRGPYRWRRSRTGRRAGCEQLGASLFEVPAGASMFPLHAHHANEELLVVLAGRPTLRRLDGERELVPGEAVAFRAGRDGAHRIDNRSDEPARILVVSTMIGPDVNEFPDSGLLWARTYPPGADPPEGSAEVHGGPGGVNPLDLP